jgi:hypothetical protein
VTGGERLEMAAPAARALRPVLDHHHVPELRACSRRAAIWLAAEDEAAADARAERQHDHVRDTPPGARLPFADRRRVRVVVEADRQAAALAHPLPQRKVGERDVHGADDAPSHLIDRRGDTEAEGDDAVLAELVDGGVQLRDDCVLRARVRRPLVSPQDLTLAVDEACEDLRAANVDSNGEGCIHRRRVP